MIRWTMQAKAVRRVWRFGCWSDHWRQQH